MKAMILAAGYGKRLAPLTNDLPKPLLKVGDKTLIEHNIETLSKYGVKEIVINVSYFDLETQDIDIETVEADTATQTKYGVVTKNINAFGTTSRGQAQRFGKWFLFNELAYFIKHVFA